MDYIQFVLQLQNVNISLYYVAKNVQQNNNIHWFNLFSYFDRFELFGGNINGEFKELVADKKLVQSWRCNQWPAGHYSTVVIELEQMADHTKLTITQTGVPERELEATKRNWKLYYWNSIKQTFGFGSYI